MKRLNLLVLLLPLLNGCDVKPAEMDPKKPWFVSRKETKAGDIMCRYKVTDGTNHEYFDDTCTRYKVGDCVKETGYNGLGSEEIELSDSVIYTP